MMIKKIAIVSLFSLLFSVSSESQDIKKIFDLGKKDPLVNTSFRLNISIHDNSYNIKSISGNVSVKKTNSLSELNYKNDEEKILFNTVIESIPNNHFFILLKDQGDNVTSIKNLGDIFRYDLSHTRLHESGPSHHHSSNATVEITISNDKSIKSFDLFKGNNTLEPISSYSLIY